MRPDSKWYLFALVLCGATCWGVGFVLTPGERLPMRLVAANLSFVVSNLVFVVGNLTFLPKVFPRWFA